MQNLTKTLCGLLLLLLPGSSRLKVPTLSSALGTLRCRELDNQRWFFLS